MRPTNVKDINKALRPFISKGWTIESRGQSGRSLAIYPPKVVAQANPDKPPFVSLHRTPSDHRSTRNLVARLRQYEAQVSDHVLAQLRNESSNVSREPTETEASSRFFCRTCGPDGPVFDTEEMRDHQEDTHSMPKTTQPAKAEPTPKHKSSTRHSKTWECPCCDRAFAPQGAIQHVRFTHADVWELVPENIRHNAQMMREWLRSFMDDRSVEEQSKKTANKSLPAPYVDPKTSVDAIFELLFPDGAKVRQTADVDLLQNWKTLTAEMLNRFGIQ